MRVFTALIRILRCCSVELICLFLATMKEEFESRETMLKSELEVTKQSYESA